MSSIQDSGSAFTPGPLGMRVAIALLLCATGSCTSAEAPLARHALSVALAGTGAGSIVSSPGGINCGSDCSEIYEEGMSVTLTASAAAGSSFTGWSGGGCTGTGACSLTATAATSVTATFTLQQYDLTVVLAGNGGGTISSGSAGIECGADCAQAYDHGTSVTLTAAPAAGSTFGGWSGAGCSGTGTCAVAVTAATSVTATFTLQQHSLAVVAAGTGAGTIASLPAGIDCGVDCEQVYDHGTSVTLTATPAIGSTFAEWSGGGCSGSGDCTVSVSAAATVTATFQKIQVALNVAKIGTGAGSVTSAPEGITCGSDCSQLYDYGASVTLTAAPAAGSVFSGWSGRDCRGTSPCTVNITVETSVTAIFALTRYALTVFREGTGSGAVTSAPAGVNCGVDCSEIYSNGTSVTLTAAAATGSTFTGWSGEGCSGTGTCTVTMTAAKNVSATFTATQHILSVLRSGTGAGSVTSSPTGITCGTDCSQTYNYGTTVTLTGAAAVGSTFAGWSGGGCTGTGSCVVNITTAVTVTATFNDVAPTITSASPSHQAIGVAPEGAFTIVFSEAMDKPATEAAFSITEPAGVTGTFSWTGNSMTFQPSKQILCTDKGTMVRWGLSTAAQDVAGNSIAAALSREFRLIRCITVGFFSESGSDGHVTNTGTVLTNGATFRVGDFANNAAARGFVSFDLSSIPSNAVVTGGSLIMYYTRLGDWNELGNLILEPVAAGTALDASDYSLPGLTASAAVDVIAGLGYWYLDNILVDAWANRATRGTRLNLRIRLTIDLLFNSVVDGFDFVSAEGGGVDRAPAIQLYYRIP